MTGSTDLGAVVTEAQRLFDHGEPAKAQRLFADAWRAAPADELELWEGLGRLAAGLSAAVGDVPGAARELRRGADLVGAYEPRPPHALDVSGLRAWAVHLADELEGGTTVTTVPLPRLRMP